VFDGLATVPMAAAFVGDYDCIAFEKDKTIYMHAVKLFGE
jgi:hypothetical protein